MTLLSSKGKCFFMAGIFLEGVEKVAESYLTILIFQIIL